MNKQIRVLRLLEYTGSSEDVAKHLSQRGVKEISPNWDGGKVVIRESFIENKLGGWEPLPAEDKPSSSYELAMAHLTKIDVAHCARTEFKFLLLYGRTALDSAKSRCEGKSPTELTAYLKELIKADFACRSIIQTNPSD